MENAVGITAPTVQGDLIITKVMIDGSDLYFNDHDQTKSTYSKYDSYNSKLDNKVKNRADDSVHLCKVKMSANRSWCCCL